MAGAPPFGTALERLQSHVSFKRPGVEAFPRSETHQLYGRRDARYGRPV